MPEIRYQGTETYSIKLLEIVTNEGIHLGIFNTFSSIHIFEDMFNNYLHGYITIEDNNELQQICPLVGDEFLNFTFNTDNNVTDADVVLEFKVYKVETVDSESDKTAHKLYFISKEGYNNANQKISKSYKNKSLEFIVNDAWQRISTKPITFTPFTGLYHIISPNWSPLQLINYMTSIAQPAGYVGSMVVFYETLREFNYRHIEELYLQEPTGVYSGKEVSMNYRFDELAPNKNMIDYIVLRNSPDTLKSMNEGMVANRVLSLDNITKTYNENKYDYFGEFGATRHLNQYRLVPDGYKERNPDQRITYLPSNSDRFLSGYYRGKVGGPFVGDRKEIVTKWRTTLLSQLNSRQIEVDTDGYTKLHVGEVIEIKLPNATALDSQRFVQNRYNTKKAIVTKIAHTFDRKKHIAKYIASDDTFPDNLHALPEIGT